MQEPRFDHLSSSYEELLKDPIRDRFTRNESQFFHQRKCDLIRQFFSGRKIDTRKLRYLDVGCGRGELLNLLRADFQHLAGCDVSTGMMESVEGIETRVQENPLAIPFPDSSFDFATAVCVYHHVPVEGRNALTAEIARILRPGGIFCMIEHNPVNPVTRLIVSRTPIDADAILLHSKEARQLIEGAGLRTRPAKYFLYLPKGIYRYFGWAEGLLTGVPLGGQYAMFGEKLDASRPGPS